jgi:hypothetical protein
VPRSRAPLAALPYEAAAAAGFPVQLGIEMDEDQRPDRGWPALSHRGTSSTAPTSRAIAADGVYAVLIDAAAVSLAVSAVSAVIAGYAAYVARRAERRDQQAKLTVESATASSDGDHWDVAVSNLGFHSARHVVVKILDAEDSLVASSGDIERGGPVLHPHERRTLIARSQERRSDAPRRKGPLKVRAEWKHWEREEKERHDSSVRIASPDQRGPAAADP